MGRSDELTGRIEVKLLGSLSVVRDGRDVPLVRSRKTRALLAYLAAVDRPQRRERLCELFWDVPDDPRGALRWSLSKLRLILGEALDAGHDTIALDTNAVSVDYRRVRETLSRDLRQVGVPELEELALLFRGAFLDDLSLPRCPEFEAWRVALANDAELMQLRLRRTLIDKLTKDDPDRALTHARALAALSTDDRALTIEIEALLQRSRQALSQRAASAEHSPARKRVLQDVRYCTAPDGVRIAYAISGAGYPILKCANWMSHLQFEWESPIWRHWMEGLSATNQLIRYDQRGNGLSDWNVADLSFDAMVADLESVADAAGLERFALLGISGGCAMSVAYAARHPARVSHLVLYGGRPRGWRMQGNATEIAQRGAMVTLIRTGWGLDNPAFRRMFTSLYIPEGTPEQMEWFTELQRRTISPENAARIQESGADVNVTSLLKQVSAPTLVVHATNDGIVPFAGGKEFAAGIPNARFAPLDSRNHILLESEPAFPQFLDEVRRFMNGN